MLLLTKVAAFVRIILMMTVGFVLALLGMGVLWLFILGRAPTTPPVLVDAVATRHTEVGVAWVPHIGPRTYGDCTRILSIDGGGVRGLVPALLLAEIERRTGKPISQQFDLIVGTSTGSILALGLARPSEADARKPAFSAAYLADLYRAEAHSIFPNSYAQLRALQRIFRPKFLARGVERLYAKYFSDVQMMEALTNVAVPAYDIENSRRLWFQSVNSAQGSLLMRDVVRAATAAPTYFTPARLAVPTTMSSNGSLALVDGALFANNPAQDALIFGQRIRGEGEHGGLMLLSLGTGRSAQKHTFEEAWGWGVLGWTDPLLEIAFADPAIDDIMSRTLEGKGDYFRLQVDLGATPIDLDDSSEQALSTLERVTAAYIKAHDEDLTSIATELLLPRDPQCGPPVGADYDRPDGPRRHQGSSAPMIQ